MKLKDIPDPVWTLAAATVGGYILYRLLAAVIEKGKEAFNPTSEKNVFYSGANAVGSALGGDEDFSLGAKIYDWTHPREPFTR